MQLNGWKRIGIVMSVFWILGAGIYQRNYDLKEASSLENLTYSLCADHQKANKNFDNDCMKVSHEDFDSSIKYSWVNVAVTALVPIPLFWLIIYGLIKIYRWIRLGFKQ
jgi:hypothetical protein